MGGMEITKRFVHYLLKPSLRPLPVSCVAASLVTGIDVALLSLPLKPLSHQDGVLTVIPRRPKKMQNAEVRMHHRSNAVASPWDAVGSHRTPSDGAHFEYTQNKHRHPVFAQRPNRAQRGHRKVTIAAQ